MPALVPDRTGRVTLVSIVNRRNAVLGWVVWETGKRVAKRKAKSVVPGVETPSRRKSAIAAVLAATAGTLMFWRRRNARARAVPD